MTLNSPRYLARMEDADGFARCVLGLTTQGQRTTLSGRWS